MITPIRIPKHSPWVVKYRVVSALLRGEMTKEFGKYRLGFFWMLFEPLTNVIVLGVLVGTFLGRTVPEIPFAFFLLIGKMFLNVFKGSINAGIKSVGGKQEFLVYPTVKALDTCLACFLYELLTTVFAFTLFCVIGMWLGIRLSLASLDILMACFLMTWLMGCGLGLILGVVVAHFNELDKVIKIALSPLMLVSCVIIPLSSLPVEFQNILLYNPLVHTIELSRIALFPHYASYGPNLFYPFVLAMVFLSFGLTLFHGNRHFLSRP